jgi:dTDP-4-dehydrorhamnose reductase
VDNPLPTDRYLNRELSWLDFNNRVLTLAADTSLPLLERAKFLAIFASNLDEFYMVRVAGLKRRDEMKLSVRSADGLSPREQLRLIGERTQQLAIRHAQVFLESVQPALAGLYHLVAGGQTTWHGYASHVIAQARLLQPGLALKVSEIAPVPTSAFPTPAQRPLNSRLATHKLQDTFGVVLSPWQQGVNRMLAEIL